MDCLNTCHRNGRSAKKKRMIVDRLLEKEESMDIKKRIEELTPEMIANLARLVKYDSVRGEALPGKPFGEAPAAVLQEALQLVEEMGFAAVNVDNYCGYAQIGEGKDIIGIAGHLDIVPAGEGWSTDPFTLTEKDGVLYGRGVSDDKGAVIAALYALKLVQEEGIPLNKRIRVIMGCAEETGSQCMAHYMKVEEPLTVGFTPDGAFPGIYGEKSGMGLMIRSKKTKILEMTGGTVSNAVCQRCRTVVPADAVDGEALKKALAETALTSFSVTEEKDTLVIDAVGVAAHASTPLLGVNAAGCTMQALAAAGMQDDFVDYYNSHVGTACDGAGYGINVKDDYGELTFNNGVVKTENGVICCTIDCRVPVTYTGEQMREMIAPYLEDEKGSCEVLRTGKPLFFPPDSPMVKALHQAYVDVTGDTVNQPQVIGGGTYAKELTGIIAFGCEFPNEDNHIHNADEFLKIDQFKLQVEIYVQAIKNLLAL